MHDSRPDPQFLIAGKRIPKKAATELLEKGITNTIKGFKSKEASNFSAKLKIQKDGIWDSKGWV